MIVPVAPLAFSAHTIDKIDNADVIVIGGGLARAKKWREKTEERKIIAEAQTHTLTEYLANNEQDAITSVLSTYENTLAKFKENGHVMAVMNGGG
jgi:hypothetical protein